MRRISKLVAVCLLASAFIVMVQISLAQQPSSLEELPRGTVQVAPDEVDRLFDRSDSNKDRRLNADEASDDLRERFGRIDLNHDGYISHDELKHFYMPNTRPALNPGAALTDHLIAVVDDFIVDVYHNGERVPDSKRTLLHEIFGATVEKIDIQVHKGDWLVFNVVNNRMRWNGARYFAVAGIKEGSGTAFTTDVDTKAWSRCDSPSQVSAFISDPKFLASQLVYGIDTPWSQGNELMNQYADGWKGLPVWGENRNTWIKYVAP